MKIIFSPTKTMEYSDRLGSTTPLFIAKAKDIVKYLQDLDDLSLNKIWKVSDKLFIEAKNNLNNIDFNKTSRALFSYNGISFKYLDPKTLDASSLAYLDNNLRILSGLYGVLRPSDGIVNYRLEMNYAKRIWQDLISKEFLNEDFIINLASNEYSQMLEAYGIKTINIRFLKNKKGVLKEESTESKMMRGSYLRYLALNRITNKDELKNILMEGYEYRSDLSNDYEIIFVKNR